MTQPKNTVAKRPDDKPFDFNLDAAHCEVDLTPFVFQYSGRRWSMEHLQALDVMPLLEAAQGGDAAAVVGTFQVALGDEWPEFRKVGLPQFKAQKLFEAYQAHCGTTLGESAASPAS